jgi:hypothetical protein
MRQRWTIAVQWDMNAFTPVTYGVYRSHKLAEAQAERWQKKADKVDDLIRVVAVPLNDRPDFLPTLDGFARQWQMEARQP